MARTGYQNIGSDVHIPRFVPSEEKNYTDFAVWKNEIIKRGGIVHSKAGETIVEALNTKKESIGSFDLEAGTGEIK